MSSTPSRNAPARHHIDALKRRIAYLQDRIRTPHHDNRFRKGRKYELAELNALEWALKQLHVSEEQDALRRASTASFLGQTTYDGTPSDIPTQRHILDDHRTPLQRASTASFLAQTTYEGTPSEPPTGNVWFPGGSTTTPEERADRR